MTTLESQEMILLGRQIKIGPEAERFKRYEYLVGELLWSMREDGFKEGVSHAIKILDEDSRIS
ncbi:hypothetical protein Desaci_2004 [Desulfosporosinus acidiphilus SJ4]|uniref:Uncharacterized protein n=1 Tax=Desulfosporosinus acidiphilus (strain DSM 22704 / JCM 16185 / SJ4) TaxID=646529 RepID=I4D5A5_DESAJ|nr:hypothetical protein [Desulfosporosinus acidiphilus]AFM40979.1 hypothetical protein Desaci_2004 [Desulfosporosinus acidiphilus SJ4]